MTTQERGVGIVGIVLLVLVFCLVLGFGLVSTVGTCQPTTVVETYVPVSSVAETSVETRDKNANVLTGQFSIVQHRDIPLLMGYAYNTIISISEDSFSWTDGTNRHIRTYTVRRRTHECVEIEFATMVASTKVARNEERWPDHKRTMDCLVGCWTISSTYDAITSTCWLLPTKRTHYTPPLCLRKVVHAEGIVDIEGSPTFRFGAHVGHVDGFVSHSIPTPLSRYQFLGLFEVSDNMFTIGGTRMFHIDAYIQEPMIVMGCPMQNIPHGDLFVTESSGSKTDTMDGLMDSLRGMDTVGIGAHWLESAQSEHVSVLAFLKLGEELMALGCPLQILADVCKAACDEVRHAQLSLEIAEAMTVGKSYSIGPVGTHTVDMSELLQRNLYETAEEEKALLTLVEKRDIYKSTLLARQYDSIISDETRHVELGHTISTWLRSQMDVR
jgi:hypothetical protein